MRKRKESAAILKGLRHRLACVLLLALGLPLLADQALAAVGGLAVPGRLPAAVAAPSGPHASFVQFAQQSPYLPPPRAPGMRPRPTLPPAMRAVRRPRPPAARRGGVRIKPSEALRVAQRRWPRSTALSVRLLQRPAPVYAVKLKAGSRVLLVMVDAYTGRVLR